MNKYAPLALLGLAALPVNGFFLMPCWPVSTQRLDPIVDPGVVSTHVHQIAGGNAFSPMMNYSDTQSASCTTCFVKGDKSNYWIPALYLKHSDGTFERVPQVGSASMYYFNEASRLGPGEKMEPFPKGLRMLAGDPDKRAGGTDAASQAINYKCLDYSGTPSDSKTFPSKNCANGVRAEVTFPSCWDGKNLDSNDHKSHMAYPTGNFENGACPSTHPHHLVTLKVEFIFDTNKFKDQWTGGKQPFVWANGDSTGYSLHADYMMGWDYSLLSSAVAQCFDQWGVLENCAPFAGQIQSAYTNPGTCMVDSFVDEDVGGKVAAMPSGNNVQMKGKWAGAKNGILGLVGIGGGKSSATSGTTSSAGKNTPSYLPSATPESQPFYGEGDAAASPSSSPSSVLAGPPPDSIPSQSHERPVGKFKTVTVTDIVTETVYVPKSPAAASTTTPAAGAPTTKSATAPAQTTPSWIQWRRDFGDGVHKHHLRHLRQLRHRQLHPHD